VVIPLGKLFVYPRHWGEGVVQIKNQELFNLGLMAKCRWRSRGCLVLIICLINLVLWDQML